MRWRSEPPPAGCCPAGAARAPSPPLPRLRADQHGPLLHQHATEPSRHCSGLAPGAATRYNRRMIEMPLPARALGPASLLEQLATLRQENAALRRENAALRAENAAVQAESAVLHERVRELEGRLG